MDVFTLGLRCGSEDYLVGAYLKIERFTDIFSGLPPHSFIFRQFCEGYDQAWSDEEDFS